MAPFIESFSRGLASGSLVEGKKEHASLCAEALLLARRMPSGSESLRREDNPSSAGFRDCVAAFFFERAHESGNSRAAWSDARRGGYERVPLLGAQVGVAMTFNGHKDRQLEDVGVAVGEPFPPEEFNSPDGSEVFRFGATHGGAHCVFAYVATEGLELPVALDNPIVPFLAEDVAGWRVAGWRVAALAASLRRRAGRNTRGAGRNTWRAGRKTVVRNARGLACCRVCGNDLPVLVTKGFRHLAYDYAERYAVGRGLYLDHQVNVIWHHDEWRNRFYASPFFMECAYDSLEGDCNGVAHEAPVFCDSGKVGKSRQAFEGHHVEEGRLVVEIEESCHEDIIAFFSPAQTRRPQHAGRRPQYPRRNALGLARCRVCGNITERSSQ